MSEQEYIKRALKEADLYRTQGLFSNARQKYLETLDYVGKSEKFSKQLKLIHAIKGKIGAVEKALTEIKESPATRNSPRKCST